MIALCSVCGWVLCLASTNLRVRFLYTFLSLSLALCMCHRYNLLTQEAFSIPFGGIVSWTGAVYGGQRSWGIAPKKTNESGFVLLFVTSKHDEHADQVVMLVRDAAKAIHNYLCILYDKQNKMVATRSKTEIEDDMREEREAAKKGGW